MTTVGKVITGVSTLGALGGGGILVNKLLDNTDTIGARLTSEGFNINIDNGEWSTILIEHNKINNLEGTFKNNANTALKLNELQEKCKSALNNKKDNEKNYKKARQWCVKPETIEVILTNGKHEVLNSTEGNSTKDKEWKKLAEKLNQDKPSFPTIGNQMQNNPETDFKALKTGCRNLALNTTKTTASDFNSKFDNAKKWCSIKQTSNK